MADCSVPVSQTKSYDLLMVNNKAPMLGSRQYGICWNGGVAYRSGEFWPYRFDITGKVNISYNSAGDLIVTLTNILIIPAGPSDVYGSTRPHPAPWYGSIASNVPAYRSIALAVNSVQQVPSEGSPLWHKCLGGWYAGGVTCGTACVTDKWGNKPGGTWYYWSDHTPGTAYDKSNYQHGARRVPDQTWNLGKIRPENGNTVKIWVIAHAQQAVAFLNNNTICNQPFAGGSYVSGLSFDVPVLEICPPELLEVEQRTVICDGCVFADMTFAASDLGGQSGVNLAVEFIYEGQSWDQASRVVVPAVKDVETVVTSPCLLPEKRVCWRARYELSQGFSAESKWTSQCFKTAFIPSVGMIVPDINDTECTEIGQGKYVEQFDKEVGYYG